ncbi:MAG: hypothetical protein NUV74_01305, partial [Candidatus Brocadiaceae bacterium]|nr:hypothetical protein [Candidatus Brocadiaceae bacterium]
LSPQPEGWGYSVARGFIPRYLPVCVRTRTGRPTALRQSYNSAIYGGDYIRNINAALAMTSKIVKKLVGGFRFAT